MKMVKMSEGVFVNPANVCKASLSCVGGYYSIDLDYVNGQSEKFSLHTNNKELAEAIFKMKMVVFKR